MRRRERRPAGPVEAPDRQEQRRVDDADRIVEEPADHQLAANRRRLANAGVDELPAWNVGDPSPDQVPSLRRRAVGPRRKQRPSVEDDRRPGADQDGANDEIDTFRHVALLQQGW